MSESLVELETLDTAQIDDIMAGAKPEESQMMILLQRILAKKLLYRRTCKSNLICLVSGSLIKESPRLMGVINLTTDSFSDGGHLFSGDKVDLSKALRKVEKLINEGADILDFGAESTRPGFTEIPSQVQIDRLIPILEQIKDEDIMISVDSRDYKVLCEASKFGMKFINDVSKNISQKLKLAKKKNFSYAQLIMEIKKKNIKYSFGCG